MINNRKSKKKKEEVLFSRNSLKESLDYIYESRNYIYFGIAVFVLFALICFIFPDQISLAFEKMLGVNIDDYLKKIILSAGDKEGFWLAWFIFKNNFSVATVSLFNFSLILQIFGSTDILQAIALIILLPVYSLFGILPVFFAVINGGIIGYVFARVYDVAGVWEFWRILPHGIFELPAIFISIGLGIKNGLFLISKKPLYELKRRFYLSFKVLIFVILPLLVAAAFIETLLITYFG